MAAVDDYFDSYDNLEIHRLMLSDKPRTEAYKNAILQNASEFKNKVVMGKIKKYLLLFIKRKDILKPSRCWCWNRHHFNVL